MSSSSGGGGGNGTSDYVAPTWCDAGRPGPPDPQQRYEQRCQWQPRTWRIQADRGDALAELEQRQWELKRLFY